VPTTLEGYGLPELPSGVSDRPIAPTVTQTAHLPRSQLAGGSPSQLQSQTRAPLSPYRGFGPNHSSQVFEMSSASNLLESHTSPFVSPAQSTLSLTPTTFAEMDGAVSASGRAAAESNPQSHRIQSTSHVASERYFPPDPRLNYGNRYSRCGNNSNSRPASMETPTQSPDLERSSQYPGVNNTSTNAFLPFNSSQITLIPDHYVAELPVGLQNPRPLELSAPLAPGYISSSVSTAQEERIRRRRRLDLMSI
jgi:hypothetical protein